MRHQHKTEFKLGEIYYHPLLGLFLKVKEFQSLTNTFGTDAQVRFEQLHNFNQEDTTKSRASEVPSQFCDILVPYMKVRRDLIKRAFE
jgi:hypothetical protein